MYWYCFMAHIKIYFFVHFGATLPKNVINGKFIRLDRDGDGYDDVAVLDKDENNVTLNAAPTMVGTEYK